MKKYHSIPKADANNFPCIAFNKYDGSNISFLWQKKKGFVRFASRNHILEESNPVFGCAMNLFKTTYGEALEKIFVDNRWEETVSYCEFFGPHSFAGQHDPKDLNVESNDPKELVLFDVNVHQKGLVSPDDFIKMFSSIRIPEVIYRGPLTKEFINDIKEGKYQVVEGCVCKGNSGHSLWMSKIKTNAYLQKLKEKFKQDWVMHE